MIHQQAQVNTPKPVDKQQILSNIDQFIPVSTTSQLSSLVKQFGVTIALMIAFLLICIVFELIAVFIFRLPPFIGSGIAFFSVIAAAIYFVVRDDLPVAEASKTQRKV